MIKTTIDKNFFEYDWKCKSIVMHCSKEEYAETFCKIMDECDLWWAEGDSYLSGTLWHVFGSDTCYAFNIGRIENRLELDKDTTVLEFEDFIIPEEEPKEINKQWFNYWKDKKVVMHCPKEEYAETFCKIMHEHGLKWDDGWDGISYLEKNNWDTYKADTCYDFNYGEYCHVDYFEDIELEYQILEFEDYIVEEQETTPELTPELLPTPADIMKEAINSICLSVDDFIIDSIKEDFHLDLRKTKDYLTFQNNFKVMKRYRGLYATDYEIYCNLTDKLLKTYTIRLEKDNDNV